MAWNMDMEDIEHRSRRVKMFREQHLSHDLISQIFAQEEQESIAQQAEQLKQLTQETHQIEETAIKNSIFEEQQYEINKLKLDTLKRIDEETKKLETTYDDAETLAYYLRKDIFNHVPANSNQTIIIVAVQEADKWLFKVFARPEQIDVNKIMRVNLIGVD